MKTKIQRYISRFRKKYVPKKYNQIKMLDYLTDDDVDHYISISNRADGKSYNYIHFFMRFAIDFDVNFMLIARHFTIQQMYVDQLRKIASTFSKSINPKNLQFINSQFYIKVIYKTDKGAKTIGLITDLNEAQDLKYNSAYLSDFPIIIFDEFLVLETDYLPDEYERLQTIYTSVNRKENIDYIHFPKIFYLGNAVNFSSPILMNLGLFNKIENQSLNTIQKYGNKVLEINKNLNANEIRNTRAFDEEHDNVANVEFSNNKYLLPTENQRKQFRVYGEVCFVKLERNYLRIDFVFDKGLIMLSIVGFVKEYDYNLREVDSNDKSIFLKETYYSDNYPRRFQKGEFLFENAPSRYYVLRDSQLLRLKITRLVSEVHARNNEDLLVSNEKKYNDNYISRTKRELINKFLSGY